jgi:hypothetical protein
MLFLKFNLRQRNAKFQNLYFQDNSKSVQVSFVHGSQISRPTVQAWPVYALLNKTEQRGPKGEISISPILGLMLLFFMVIIKTHAFQVPHSRVGSGQVRHLLYDGF